MKTKPILLAGLLASMTNANAIDFNDNRQAIENIKGSWFIFYIDNHSKFIIETFSISSIAFAFDAGFYGKGYNLYEEFGFIGGASEIGCFYINKPSVSERHYGCGDGKAKYLTYYSFDLENDVIKGQIGFNFDRINNQPIRFYPVFTGYQKVPDNPMYGDYRSDYQLIQWNKRGSDNGYCIEIFDDNWNEYAGMRPLKCGDDMANFSPKDFVANELHGSLPTGFAFRWRIWSRNVGKNGETIGTPNYAGEGYEGRVVVP